MEKLNLNKQTYDKRQYEKVIDTSFKQLITPQDTSSLLQPSVSVQQFFQYYEELFYTIPKQGDTNSHEYLIKTSSEYVNFQQSSEEIQALIEEITSLRQENLELQQQLLTSITGSIEI